MPLAIQYSCQPETGAPHSLTSAAIRAVAAQVRAQVARNPDSLSLTTPALLQASQRVVVNGRAMSVVWDLAHAVHDEAGRPVLGICATEPDEPGCAYVSVNAKLTANRPDLELSTAAHELGHVLFDVPAALHAGCALYRAVAASAAALERQSRGAEGRANEFMGALLTPPIALHTRMLALARNEGMRFARGPHQGRPGSPILSTENPPEIIGGLLAALSCEFGVSDRFVEVRLRRYGLLQESRT